MKASRSHLDLMRHAGGLFLVVLSVLAGWHRRGERHAEAASIPRSVSPPKSVVGRAVAHSALHERILFFYVLGLLIGVAYGGGEHRATAALTLSADLILLSIGIIAVRAPLLENRFARALVARLVVFAGLLGSFLQLDVILPAARSGTVDTTLHAFDLRLFGFEPAVALDRWVNPMTTEWFSFFYFSYFVLLAIHVLPFMFVERRLRVVGEFALGMVAVYCIGQLTYMIVPGFGPYKTLSFVNPLVGDTWWPLVQSGAVAVNESSRTDIFPSLHTAGPVFLGLFSFRHRALRPFKYTWPVVGFFAIQIMIATMFLRWHYLIDVLAGVGLAVVATKIATYGSVEVERRAELREAAPIWTPLRLGDLFGSRSVNRMSESSDSNGIRSES